MEIRCSFCDRLVSTRDGVAGQITDLFICDDCVDLINEMRAGTLRNYEQ